MKHALLLTLAAAATLSAAPLAGASAQTATAPAAAPATAQPQVGISPADLSAWLTSRGATVEPVQTSGERRFMKVTTDGLPWVLFLQSCDATACSDFQFTAALSDPSITLDKVNGWNRDRRFVKAIYEAPDATSPASAVAQFDVLIGAGGPEQLVDHLAVWRALLVDFVRTLMPAPPAAAPATPPAGD
jgi:hypothetical protein